MSGPDKLQEMIKRMAESIRPLFPKFEFPKLNIWQITGLPDLSKTKPFNNVNPYEPKIDIRINFNDEEGKPNE